MAYSSMIHASLDGPMYHIRSLPWPGNVQDCSPIADRYLQRETQLQDEC